jgi:hypothetical protein
MKDAIITDIQPPSVRLLCSRRFESQAEQPQKLNDGAGGEEEKSSEKDDKLNKAPASQNTIRNQKGGKEKQGKLQNEKEQADTGKKKNKGEKHNGNQQRGKQNNKDDGKTAVDRDSSGGTKKRVATRISRSANANASAKMQNNTHNFDEITRIPKRSFSSLFNTPLLPRLSISASSFTATRQSDLLSLRGRLPPMNFRTSVPQPTLRGLTFSSLKIL